MDAFQAIARYEARGLGAFGFLMCVCGASRVEGFLGLQAEGFGGLFFSSVGLVVNGFGLLGCFNGLVVKVWSFMQDVVGASCLKVVGLEGYGLRGLAS